MSRSARRAPATTPQAPSSGRPDPGEKRPDPGGGRTGVSRRGVRARLDILRAAGGLFAERGYRGAPLAAVAAEAGMTQPGLLHHFPSKEHLLMAVLAERDREARRRMRVVWDMGGRAALSALEDLVAHNAETRDLVQLFTVLAGESVSAEHPAHEFFTARYAQARERTRRVIERGQDRGEFRRDVDPAVVAALLLAVMDGLQIQWLLDEEVDMRAGFALLVDLLLRGLDETLSDADES
ncbi:MAG: TetR/AcrR family transcriptional regulator [Dactylosporangium sp.]|nr:TetR/AcrR family transcriptional regulator [Dactylosporangium sp.]NNJ62801.1 TetR/AcrR family transcriptional regulator [Dactylosporangium sp.]